VPAFQGVSVAAVTPRQPDSTEIDLSEAFELVDYLCSHGAQGIALFGSTGEFVHFDLQERLRSIRLVTRRSRAPVMVGAAHSTLDGTLTLGREAADAGAAAVIVMPPYFFRYTQEEIRHFYLTFAREMADAIPLYLYNIPFFTNPMEVETLKSLLSTGQFAGMKDSTDDLDRFRRLQALRPGIPFALLVGNDAIFRAARSAGADGVVSGVACAAPELMLGLDRAIQAGNQEQADRLEARLNEFLEKLDCFPTPVAVRAATETRGVRLGPCAIPFSPDRQRQLLEFQEWFRGWLPAVQKEARNV
jgi:4-hydroxy-tetrahydrodipicolinate synthase